MKYISLPASIIFGSLLLFGCSNFSADKSGSKEKAPDSAPGSPQSMPSADELTTPEEIVNGTAQTGIQDEIKFSPEKIDFVFDRGSSRCCGPVHFGSVLKELNVRITSAEVPDPQTSNGPYLLWIQYFGTPVDGKLYPVKWYADEPLSPDYVYVRVIQTPKSQSTWAKDGVTVEGAISFTGLGSIAAETSNVVVAEKNLVVTTQYNLKFSTGTMTGQINGKAIELLSECKMECSLR